MTGEEILGLTASNYNLFKKSGTTAVNLLWLNQIGTELYESIQKIMPEAYISEQDYTLVAGTYQYDLPSDFDNINLTTMSEGQRKCSYSSSDSVYYDFPRDQSVLCGLFKFSDGNLSRIWNFTGRGSSLGGYWLNNADDKLEITPRDHTYTDELTLRYIPRLTKMTSLSDNIFVPRDEDYKWQQFWIEALKELWARDVDKNEGLQSQFSLEKKRQFDRMMMEVAPKKKRIIKL